MTGSVWVKCENRPEYCYMVAWCEDCGMGTPLKSGPNKYPVAIVIDKSGGRAGWSDHMDRAADYCTFAEFVTQNNPMTYEHNGLQAVRLGAGDALDARDALHDIMPFVEEDYWPDLSTPEYRAAVEHARACLACRQRNDEVMG